MACLDLSRSPFGIAVAPARTASSSLSRSVALHYLPHIASAGLISLMFALVLAAVGDPMVAAMLALVLAIPLVCFLWADRTNVRHRS